MSYKDDIRYAVEQIAASKNTFSKLCQVLEVDKINLTCDVSPVDGGPDILNVRILPVSGINGFYMIPKTAVMSEDGEFTTDSFVIVSFFDESSGYISMFGQIDTVFINGNDFGGLVKVNDLTTKLNNLENKVNSIITTYNTHTHPYVNVSTPAVTSVSTAVVAGTLTPTTAIQISSTYSYHGSGINNI